MFVKTLRFAYNKGFYYKSDYYLYVITVDDTVDGFIFINGINGVNSIK